jgi:hypothetical protein
MAFDQDPQAPQQPTQGQPPQGQYSPQPQYPPQGPSGPYGPRHEKQDEKGQEKHQEKGQGMDEKYHRNPLGFVSFGLLVVWLGVTLLLRNAGVFTTDDHGWAMFFWGWGAITLLEAVVRVAVPRFRRSVMAPIIWGAVLLMVGFGLWFDSWKYVWPIAVIAVGVAMLVNRIVPRR